MTDKNQAIIDYLTNCPYVENNPLFFNFGNAKDSDIQIVAQSNDVSLNKTYVDGSVLKRFTFNLLIYKSVSYNPLVTAEGYLNENIEEVKEVQNIIDWITTQNRLENFPDFGSDCTIESIEALTNNPSMNGVNSSVMPPLATYNISINVTYCDFENTVWNRE